MPYLRQWLPICASLLVACGSTDAGFTNPANNNDASAGAGGVGGVGSSAGGKATGSSTGGRGAGGNGAGGNGAGGNGAGGNGAGGNGAGGNGAGGGAGTNGGGAGTGARSGAGGVKDAGPTDVTDAKGVGLDATPPPAEAAACAGAMCSASCTDLATDPLNCGTCGAAVCHNEACKGTKVCAPGLSACGGAGTCLGCKNFKSDPANCGTCGKACSASEVCSAGKCSTLSSGTCSGGLTPCPSSGTLRACVDTTRDITNCGVCGKNCSPGEFCTAGSCTKYVTAPGCTACPCAACTAPTTQCCRYADGNVCAAQCPAG